MMPALNAKKFDMIVASMSITEERKKAVDFSSSYYDLSQAVVSYKGSPIADVTTVAGLKDAKLGAAIGAHPHARRRGIAHADEAVGRDRVDQALLEPAHIRMHLEPEPLDVEDRIRDELPGPVVGHIAAAVGLDLLDPVRGKHRVAREDMRGRTHPLRHRDDRRIVLEEKHRHRRIASARLARGHERRVRLALDRERIGVPDATEVDDAERGCFGDRTHVNQR